MKRVDAPATPPHSTALYPREYIPKHPVLSTASFTQYSGSGILSVLDAGSVHFANRGCMAIGLALQHAQVGCGDEVLLPAYHCISMIEPVVWRDARPVFYRINANTSVDLADVESRLTTRTRALLVTHYFGFLQDIRQIRKFCDIHGILLIEDCAHAFFGSFDSAPVGSFGDYSIASAWKFFPIYDGGLLISGRRDLSSLKPKSWGLRFQAKALVNTLEQSFAYRRLTIARLLLKVPLQLKDILLRQMKQGDLGGSIENLTVSTGLGGWGFDATRVTQKMSITSSWITTLTSKRRIIQRRRRNYKKLLTELGSLSGCRPLFAALPDGVVPQVFPLLFDEPERLFPLLKKAGVPIIRFGEFLWEGMDAATCPVSLKLSRCVFQLPCHQELTDAELDWMICQVKEVTMQ